MTKLTRRRFLRPLHATLTFLTAATAWCAAVLDRISSGLGKLSDLCDPARGAADMIELRDALTGEPLGMTKKQYRRYVLALGSEDPRAITKAARELQERRRGVLASIATAACLLIAAGCTRSNDARLCVPGQQQECACPGALKGAQSCLDDGSGFAECQGCGITTSQDFGVQATLDLAGVDFAQADLHGADFAGQPVPDLANPAFNGISCGSATCGPVGGNLGCCATVSGGSSTLACYPDTSACPPSNQAVALCDGPEDCAGATCVMGLNVDKDTGLQAADTRCRPSGSYTVQVTVTKVNGQVQSSALTTVACHSNDDCVGVHGNVPSFGTVPFATCCHYAGYQRTFCANGPSTDIVCP